MKKEEILQGLRELSFHKNEGVIVDLARMYGATQGWDVDDFLGRRGDYKFWDPEYLDPSGKTPGMGTMDAFRCLVDSHRTRKLVHGIFKSVAQKKKKNQEQLIAIDAGTGTGVLAMALIAAGCDYVHALEINPQTVTAIKQVVNQLGLEDRISVVEANATQIQLTGPKAKIIVSENLSNGLFDEPHRFAIYDGIPPLYLEPDSAQFLGKSTAFRIRGDLLSGESVRFYGSYPAGIRKQYMKASAEADFVKLVRVEDL